ncbi:toll/interleukin-1 receptor domain-containing protein [Lentzea tibetensis]|uniref:toll/interleukin-1 receptor domain-containing protein n=1 Tax=Lentzea tibetensis TaxID=2591470 RepID=UPI0011B67A9D|nr:toll/interleukin-1 receptor domain-containing protein [Lentzea tibetensis]
MSDGEMRGVDLPGPEVLPPGSLRDLTEALHQLYRAAGARSLQQISDRVNDDDRFDGTVSHQKVAQMLRGVGLPKWTTLAPVVEVLAEWSTPPRDPAVEVAKLKRLWDKADGGEASDEPVAAVPAGRLRSAFVLGGVTGETTYPSLEEAELQQFSRRLGAAVARAGVDLVVCSPFPDTADFHALMGYLESGAGGTVHMHRPVHPAVDAQSDQLRELLGPTAAARIRNWYYPGPETDDRESFGQAWVLCQLMALQHADAVLAVGGKPDKTASTILHLAEARQLPIVPFAFLGGAAERAFRRRDWQGVHPWLDTSRLTDKNAVDDAMIIANEMVTARVRRIDGPQGRPGVAFVSRAAVDADFTRPMDRHLSAAGIQVLYGDQEISSARMVEAAIEDAVLRSDLFIALWSRSYAASRFCYDELDLALQRHRAGRTRLWIINLDGSDIVPPDARELPQVTARTPREVAAVVRDLLAHTG